VSPELLALFALLERAGDGAQTAFMVWLFAEKILPPVLFSVVLLAALYAFVRVAKRPKNIQ
jgi:hypothetical protein